MSVVTTNPAVTAAIQYLRQQPDVGPDDIQKMALNLGAEATRAELANAVVQDRRLRTLLGTDGVTRVAVMMGGQPGVEERERQIADALNWILDLQIQTLKNVGLAKGETIRLGEERTVGDRYTLAPRTIMSQTETAFDILKENLATLKRIEYPSSDTLIAIQQMNDLLKEAGAIRTLHSQIRKAGKLDEKGVTKLLTSYQHFADQAHEAAKNLGPVSRTDVSTRASFGEMIQVATLQGTMAGPWGQDGEPFAELARVRNADKRDTTPGAYLQLDRLYHYLLEGQGRQAEGAHYDAVVQAFDGLSDAAQRRLTFAFKREVYQENGDAGPSTQDVQITFEVPRPQKHQTSKGDVAWVRAVERALNQAGAAHGVHFEGYDFAGSSAYHFRAIDTRAGAVVREEA